MSIRDTSGVLAAYLNETPIGGDGAYKTASGTVSFAQQIQKIKSARAAGFEAYVEYLRSWFGNVAVQSVGKDQKSMDSLGAGTSGTGNVVIAPNVLEQMANSPEKAAYYEGKIQNYFDSVPKYQAELSAMGHEIHSSGIVIHPDGTVTHYISGDLKPEVRARIEAQVKAEQEEKANRRQMFQQLHAEAAENRKVLLDQSRQKQMLAESLKNQFPDINLYFMSQPQAAEPAALSYESAAMALRIRVTENL